MQQISPASYIFAGILAGNINIGIMHKYRQRLGKRGEGIALRFLEQKGYVVIARNFACKLGEIDIVARQGKTTVFIEVKTRSSCQFGLPQESIKPKKIKHLLRCAQFYIKNYCPQEENFRFDVISIILGNPPQIELIANAF